MNLVDRHRLAARIALAAAGDEVGVVEGEGVGPGHHRGGRGAEFAAEADGIGLQRQHHVVGADDLVFVDRALADLGREDLPDAAVDALAHLVAAAVPVVEVADHGDAPRLGRPDSEMHARNAAMRHHMRPELLVELPVRALDEQMIVERAEDGAEGIGVDQRPAAAGIRRAQPIEEAAGAARDQRLEEIRAGAPLEGRHRLALEGLDRHAVRMGDEGSHRHPRTRLMQAEQGERIPVPRRDQISNIDFIGTPTSHHASRIANLIRPASRVRSRYPWHIPRSCGPRRTRRPEPYS